ncbi:MAG: right-handed parallel beta-helix repeat-containing protein [Xanthomonadales bacterium]|nr:right-handed parallel beta-helix repeat-containing protein [Xanthomonadales bacterium]
MWNVNRLLMGALLLMLFCHPAAAAEYCVGTVAELNTALNQAVSPSQALFTTTIRLKQGTYHVGGSRLTQPNQAYFNALELLGGYNSDCSARTVNPDNTVFDADGATYFKFDPLSALLIEGIRFQNITNYERVEIWSAADDVSVRVHNNAFVGVGFFAVLGATPAPDFDSVSGMTMKFVNNRVHGFPSSGLAAVTMNALTQIRFTGNTIADNLGSQGAEFCSDSDIWLVDNIAWNNGGDDFHVLDDCGDDITSGDARSRSNLYQSVLLNQVGDSGSNLVGTNPLFVNSGAGNYRLQATSPAVNSGVITSSMVAIDLAGNPRVVGSTVDRGAYESTVDDTIPTTLTVTNTSDSGPGSLRQAIVDANANVDFSYINFNIPGPCPRVIAPTSADLPAIVSGVRIDGWTQPGSASNTRTKGDNATRCIVLAGGNGRSRGLQFNGTSNEQFWLQGVAFSGFSPTGGNGEALRIFGGIGNLIRGNQFGATLSPGAGSLVLAPSDTNIVLTGFSSSTVGGESPAHRNVIADARDRGVLITSVSVFSSTGNDIVDNLIGSYALEISAAGNNTGIKIQTSGNTVRENTIINNSQDGILLDVAAAQNNLIEYNRIGVRDTICTGILCFGGAAGNGRDGVLLSFGPHDNLIYNNTIKNNTSAGIGIGSSSGATSLRNWLIGNALYNNGAQGTAFNAYNGADNDASASNQDMANRGLNYPVITRAYGGTRKGWVEGTLATTNGNYILDIFSSAEVDAGFPRGEAEVFHRSFYSVAVSNAPSGQNGSASFRVPFSGSPLQSLAGRVITLTAADNVGNTSELSAPAAYLCDVIYAQAFDDASDDRCP